MIIILLCLIFKVEEENKSDYKILVTKNRSEVVFCQFEYQNENFIIVSHCTQKDSHIFYKIQINLNTQFIQLNNFELDRYNLNKSDELEVWLKGNFAVKIKRE